MYAYWTERPADPIEPADEPQGTAPGDVDLITPPTRGNADQQPLVDDRAQENPSFGAEEGAADAEAVLPPNVEVAP